MTDTKMRVLLAVDPGDTAGLAWWDLDTPGLDRPLLGMEQVKHEDLPKWVLSFQEKYKIDTIVVEQFVLFSKRAKQQSGSKMKASKGIGIYEMAAAANDAKLVMQPSNMLPAAIKISGITMPHTHSETHKFSAYAHGYLYMFNEKMTRSALQIQLGVENK